MHLIVIVAVLMMCTFAEADEMKQKSFTKASAFAEANDKKHKPFAKASSFAKADDKKSKPFAKSSSFHESHSDNFESEVEDGWSDGAVFASAGSGFGWPGAATFAGSGFGWPGAATFAGAGFDPRFFAMYPLTYMNPFARFPFVAYAPMKSWHEGENVCTERENIEEPSKMSKLLDNPGLITADSNKRSSSCEGNNEVYVCTGREVVNGTITNYVIRYKCCHGFRNVNGNACIEIDIKDLVPTLRNLKAEQFLELIDLSGLSDKLYNENLTVFCPPDASLQNLPIGPESNFIPTLFKPRQSPKEVLRELITAHLVSGFLGYDDVEDTATLQTQNPRTKLRLDVYYIPERVKDFPSSSASN